MSVFTSWGFQMLDSNLVLNMKAGLLCLVSLELMVRCEMALPNSCGGSKSFTISRDVLSRNSPPIASVLKSLPIPMPYAFRVRISVSRNPKVFSRLYSFPLGTSFMSVFADFTNSSLATFDATMGVKGLLHFFGICNIMFFIHPLFHMGFHRWNLPITNVFASVKVGS